MRIKKIFVDLDDVLNYFTLHALNYVGCPVVFNDFALYQQRWQFNIVKAANELQGNHWTPEMFWSQIDRECWKSAPLDENALELLYMCASYVGKENVCILSSPIKDPECLAGKLEWIHENMPPWIHRQFLIGPAKSMCACRGALLIDDHDDNVYKFRKAGGDAVLVPRPWNHLGYGPFWKTVAEVARIIGAGEIDIV